MICPSSFTANLLPCGCVRATIIGPFIAICFNNEKKLKNTSNEEKLVYTFDNFY